MDCRPKTPRSANLENNHLISFTFIVYLLFQTLNFWVLNPTLGFLGQTPPIYFIVLYFLPFSEINYLKFKTKYLPYSLWFDTR